MGQAPGIISDLIERFDRNREAYKSQGYNETQLRREFLDPFFEALGWDVANKAGHAEAYKDVIHEDAIKIGGASKAPDYCFRIGGARKFFLEAKKPAVNVKDEIPPAYQLRRYAWSAKLPLSILTDFEEFAVYDCRTRPNPSDKPGIGRIHYWTYKDYPAEWHKIAAIFSKDSVLKGSFDKYAGAERKRGTATVDAEFLKEIESWREALAKNLALRNPKLSVQELNFSVQRTIDRLIFLRICEDRGVESYGQLQGLQNGQNIYSRLRYLYDRADDRYNSGLFHFHPEKDRAESPDDLTPRLKIDDKVLKDIIGRLYYPESPYEFSVLPVEILGQVYEQFLGKVIRLTASHQARIEEKPEVRKAGGVYYTPAYIVEYIVKHTVGTLCQGKTPKQIAKLRILDPACGSGSFLIGAYQFLLTYHRDWYVKDGTDKHKKELFKATGGDWRLRTEEKKRILLSNIYGVDIDPQAVEVTKLSLLLKVLEGENQESLQELLFGRVRVLPDLGKNIKCGNSLIGPDYFAGQLIPDEDEVRRVNPFDWQAEFPEIMKAGGFDAVIGNPPYGAYFYGQDKAYLSSKYPSQTYQLDSYLLFLERSMRSLVRHEGFYGMIIPNPWLTNLLQTKIRRFVFEETRVREIVHFKFSVFPKVTVDTEIVLLQNARAQDGEVVIKVFESLGTFLFGANGQGLRTILHNQKKWEKLKGDTVNIFASPKEETLLEKCKSNSAALGSLCEINVGIKPYQVGKGTPPQTKAIVQSRPFDSNRQKTTSFRPYLRGSDINRFVIAPLQPRFLRYGPWLAEPRPAADFDAPVKIVMRQTGDSLVAALDDRQYLCLNNMHVLVPHENEVSAKFLLGVINSKLLNWCYQALNPEAGEALAEVKKTNVERLPIRILSLCDKADKSRHDQMVSLVERMLDLHKRLPEGKTPADKDRLQRQINATDQEIDRLVYDLYGLTEEEIRIVEAASVASSPKLKENEDHETEPEPTDRPGPGPGMATTVAEAARYAREGGGSTPESPFGAREPVHGVREPTGQYGTPEDPDGTEEQSELSSTREFDTAEGRLSYPELSERLAVPLVAIYDEILQTNPDQIVITSEWLCIRHKRLAGHLYPDWAGRFRDVNVQVGSHNPPPFYEVPIHMRTFCDDLAERLRHDPGATVRRAAEFLAWADWRFQWIHPFKDFNGRIGRVLLGALLYKLSLPHIETAPIEPLSRRNYLDALQTADSGDLTRLTSIWSHRLSEAL